MKYIDIFLASSIRELKEERLELGNYIRSLNDMVVERGVYYRLHMCEDMSESIDSERKQNEYNEEIRKSTLFVIMFWHKAGEYTLEEFDVALECFRASGAPRIFTFFKEVGDEDRVEDSVKEFMRHLSEDVQHYYTLFRHIDSVKFKLLLTLTRQADLGAEIRVENDELSIDHIALPTINAGNLPVYGQNRSLNAAREELDRLQKEFNEAKLAALMDPGAAGLEQLLTISEKRNRKAEEIRRMEDEIMAAATHIAGITESGEYLTARAQRAIDLFERGMLEEALLILNDEERKKNALDAMRYLDHGKRELTALISEIRLKINTLRARGIGAAEQRQVIDLYREAEEYVMQGSLESSILMEYMKFLSEQRLFRECMAVGRKLLARAEYTGRHVPEEEARIYLTIADAAIALGDYEQVGEELQMARSLMESLAEPNDALLCDLYSVEGKWCWRDKRIDRALEVLQQNRRSLEALAEKAPEIFSAALAENVHCLSVVQRKMNQREAVQTADAAIAMQKKQVEDDPKNMEKLFFLSDIYNAAAITCKRFALYDQVEAYYSEAIRIRRELTAGNPVTYEPTLALILSNYSIYKEEKDQLEEAERYAEEAAVIRRRLMRGDPDRFAGVLCLTLRQLAVIQSRMGKRNEAREVYHEAIPMMEAVFRQKPGAYKSHYSLMALNYGIFLREDGSYTDSEKYLKVARDITEDLLTRTTEIDKQLRLTNCISQLALLYAQMGRFEEARVHLAQATERKNTILAQYTGVQEVGAAKMLRYWTEAEKAIRESITIPEECKIK